jgi:hypothetical protein
MAHDITAAIDQVAAQTLISRAESALQPLSEHGSTTFGPFGLAWNATFSVSGGLVSLAPPNLVRIDNATVHYSLGLTVSVDLSFLDFTLPEVCVDIPWFGELCIGGDTIHFGKHSVPLKFANTALVSGDFTINVYLASGFWNVDVVLASIRKLDLGTAATLLVTAIGTAVSLALLAVPFIGPFLAGITALVTAGIGVAQITGVLGNVVSLFVSGLTFNVVHRAQTFQAISAAGPFDPAVLVTIPSLTAQIQATDKNELVVSADIS